MRHLKSGRQLSRNSSHRWALMRNLITALLREEKIQTTDPKAKELRRWVDRVITLGKRGSLHARRQALGHRPGQNGGAKTFRHHRAAFQRPPRRIHANHQAGDSPRRCRANGVDRAGRCGRRKGSPENWGKAGAESTSATKTAGSGGLAPVRESS